MYKVNRRLQEEAKQLGQIIEDECINAARQRDHEQKKLNYKRRYLAIRNRRRLIYLAAIMVAIVLTLSTTACAGVPKPEIRIVTRMQVEYVMPDIPTFPVFPLPDCVEYSQETDTVAMPLWYWAKIAEYKIDVDAIEEYLLRLKETIPKGE
jgi:hypothetical protein